MMATPKATSKVTVSYEVSARSLHAHLFGISLSIARPEAGQIVNPDGFRNQIEGGIIQSTSWTLREAVNFDGTRMLTKAWPDYPILRFGEIPAVDVTLINRPEERTLGAGEGSQGPTVAAIANAFFNATGKRIRDLPLTPARVKAALA